ncbi:glucosaminidase domain-containing protein [Wenyingzhuangia sp. IMCC45574]
MKKVIALGFVFVLLCSCGANKNSIKEEASKEVVSKVSFDSLQKQVHQIVDLTEQGIEGAAGDATFEYVRNYAPIAISEMNRTGIPASIILAQGLDQSGKGKNKLAKETNNHFEIFCGRGWSGARFYKNKEMNGECYRKYKYAIASFKDHSIYLTRRPSYSSLFTLNKGDYKAWAKGLKKAGYSSNPNYDKKLITCIEDYNLHKFDEIALSGVVGRYKDSDFYVASELKRDNLLTVKKTKDSIAQLEVAKLKAEKVALAKEEKRKAKELFELKKNRVTEHTVAKNETLYSIARRYNLNVAYIKSYNGLTNNTIHVGTVLKIKKHVKREGYHIVAKDETLFSLSKKYKTTVRKIKELNKLTSNIINVGQELKIE